MSDDPGNSVEDETLSRLFDEAMKLFEEIEKSNEPTCSDSAQMKISSAIVKFEKATNLVSYTGMFSRNESLEELPTEILQYLLLPALLGTLTLKLSTDGQHRKEVISVAEIYFRDYLQRCKDYGVTDVEVPQPSSDDSLVPIRPQTETSRIASMVQSREAKIKRYKEMKELQQKLDKLRLAINSTTVDEEIKRDYFTTLLQSYVNQALDELNSIEQEKPILDYMEKRAGEPKAAVSRPPPLKPVIITRDSIQKAVYGAGYPSLPTMTIEEFYDNRVKEGIFPGSCNIPHSTIKSTEEDRDEAESIQKELLTENDDEEELARKRNMDEYKDDHRRGWGNRYNRS